ncbi:MAG TPA: NAD(P)H-hydrate epimerase, partial [Burkholderiaceae bacterium]|nr:NAD(P)H-hydrate epimerase [Burkholderiaceae bacterium]
MALPLPTLTELRAAEARAARDLPAGTLMHRAGEAVAQWVQRELAPGNAVTVVCGPGNNGGDGFVAARLLAERGYSVACVLIGASEPTTADARAAWSAWRASGHVVLDNCHAAPRAALVIDALLGIGLSRSLTGDYLDAAQWINERHARRLALDLPSGLDAERGTWVGGVAGVRADATLSFIAAKPGLHTADGPDAAG